MTSKKCMFRELMESFVSDMFRSACETSFGSIVKLYTQEGRLINITPSIPPNTSSNPYRLEVVAVHYNGK